MTINIYIQMLCVCVCVCMQCVLQISYAKLVHLKVTPICLCWNYYNPNIHIHVCMLSIESRYLVKHYWYTCTWCYQRCRQKERKTPETMETSHVHVIFQLFLFFYSSSFYYQLAFFVFTSHYLSSSSSSFLLLHLVFLLTLFSLLHLLYSPPSLSPLLSLLILIYSYRSTKQSRLKNRFVRTCMYSYTGW